MFANLSNRSALVVIINVSSADVGIAASNGLGKGTLIVPPNTRLRIPAKTDFLDQVIQTNRTR